MLSTRDFIQSLVIGSFGGIGIYNNRSHKTVNLMIIRSQEIQGCLCVPVFATLSWERMWRSKVFHCIIWTKELKVRKSGGGGGEIIRLKNFLGFCELICENPTENARWASLEIHEFPQILWILTEILRKLYEVLQNSGISNLESARFGILQKLLLSFLEILNFLSLQFSDIYRGYVDIFWNNPLQLKNCPNKYSSPTISMKITPLQHAEDF